MRHTEKTSGFYLYNNKLFKGNFGHYINQHLYILSNEEIKKGDYIYSVVPELHDGLRIIKVTNPSLFKLHDLSSRLVKELGIPQIPESFIKIYIEYFNSNKPITEVEVEYEEFDKKPVCVGMEGKPAKPIYNYIGEHRLKLQKDNTIEISLVENNSIGTYIAVFRDGEYKNIIVVQAEDIDDADRKLKEQGFEWWDRLEPVEYDEKGICFAINGLR